MDYNDKSQKEIIFEIPPNIANQYDEESLLIAYNCIVLERSTGKSYIYTAVNLDTGRSVVISRRQNQLTTGSVPKLVEKLRNSSVRGAGQFEIDMPPGESLKYMQLVEILKHIFCTVLPEHGYTLRKKQAELALHILNTICSRCISLSEAEVGTGKTHAYLIASIIAKRSRINDYRLRGHFPRQSYGDGVDMPVVIATSSIALQNAIVNEYIPEISKILLGHGIIRTPLSAVIRKGKEHYICEYKLNSYYNNADDDVKAVLRPYLNNTSLVDIGDSKSLSAYDKRKIGVSGKCPDNCPKRAKCRYLQHMKNVQSSKHDFQVCNHNYFLADVLKRSNEQAPLIPHYQAVVLDEGHKFLEAARQMYGVAIDCNTIPGIVENLNTFTYKKGESGVLPKELGKALLGQNTRLFVSLYKNIPEAEFSEDTERFSTSINKQAVRHLKNICDLCDELIWELKKRTVLARYKNKFKQVLWELDNICEQADEFVRHNDLVYWLENVKHDKDKYRYYESKLCAIPKKLNNLLYKDLWRLGVPIIITSGTLSAAGSFGHIKKNTGLDKVMKGKLLEISKPSPFNYKDNVLMYISENTPFPDNDSAEYIKEISTEVLKLIKAAHGHAAVLFTSYRAMDMVYKEVAACGLPFPLFRLDKGGVNAISLYRESKNGVLFASGALWEGIDLPGDILSMLIIVRLPFAVPDPISEYEKTLYKGIAEYKQHVVLPEMLVKLKQGFGRLIRTESDTGVVALLDSRVRSTGAYRRQVLSALPECSVADNISSVEDFIKQKKIADYFL